MATQYIISADSIETVLNTGYGHNLIVTRRTGAVSTASWTFASACDSEPLWPYGTEILIIRRTASGDETLFSGTITRSDAVGEGTSERIHYTASDAWWHFEREIYRHTRVIVDAEGDLSSILSSRVLLCQATDGTRLTAAQMVSALATFAASIGVNVQAGTFDAPVTPPWDEVRDRTIAEIIRRVLRWQPDAVAWIDHSTVPPTLNVTRRSNMTAATLGLTALDTVSIRSCPELVVPGVEIHFELSGTGGRTVDVQSAGDPTALGCVRMTIPLEFEFGAPGPVTDLKIVPLGDYTTLAWWQRIFPWLPAEVEITNTAISPTPPSGFVNILAGGIIPQWATDSRGISASRHTVSCTMKMNIDGQDISSKSVSRSFTLTNATKRRYIGQFAPGWTEPEPLGLAAAIYAAAGTLQYAGAITLTEAECAAGRSAMGKSLNVTGGKTAWASMAAVIVSVTERFDQGITEIEFGPQEHLGVQDLVELFRAGRVRSTWTPLDPQDAGGSKEEEVEDPFAPEDIPSDSPGKLSGIELTDAEA